MATIRQRKDRYGKTKFDVRIRMKGQPIQSGSFDRLTDARQWVQMIESDIRLGRKFPTMEAKRRTLGEAIDRYIQTVLIEKPKSFEKQSVQLEWWKRRMG